jgi:hypothetical protein
LPAIAQTPLVAARQISSFANLARTGNGFYQKYTRLILTISLAPKRNDELI